MYGAPRAAAPLFRRSGTLWLRVRRTRLLLLPPTGCFFCAPKHLEPANGKICPLPSPVSLTKPANRVTSAGLATLTSEFVRRAPACLYANQQCFHRPPVRVL